ncbi:heterokaryon incompatibility protein-domain-containing protein [Phaeosphaeriaceae sp. PMI808]|nr:heterokaryon incompatibility protein-domain-containing protein [Phaeosphaeriaceae sp. PMI808]
METENITEPYPTRNRDLIYKSKLQYGNIRILQLLPGNHNGMLTCELREVSLDPRPLYEAISYVWGSPDIVEPIICDGHTTYITISLAQALRQIRSQNESRVVWADSLCINQDDVSERSEQVQRMGDIFERAERVIIWLGLDTPDMKAKKAVATMQYVSDIAFNRVGYWTPESSDCNFDTLDEHMSGYGVDNAWEALSNFFDRKWWRRIWCAQEAILARNTLVLCGEEEMNGNLVSRFTEWYVGCDRATNKNVPGPLIHTNDGLMSAYLRLNWWSWGDSYLRTIDDFKGLEAADPRDKVYGLLGVLRRHCNDLTIIADYRKSIPEVLFDVVRQSLCSEGHLHFLSYINRSSKAKVDGYENLPSWIPSFHKDLDVTSRHIRRDFKSLAGRALELKDFPTIYSPTIALQGVQFDKISTCSEPMGQLSNENTKVTLQTFIRGYLDDTRRENEKKMNQNEYFSAISKLAYTLTAGDVNLAFSMPSFSLRRASFVAFLEFILGAPLQNVDQYLAQTLATDIGLADASWYQNQAEDYCLHRSLFKTSRGYVGLGPGHIMGGDIVVVLNGGQVPYVLRPFEKDGEHEFVGECYMRDIMRYEIYKMLGVEGVDEKIFKLR